MFTECQTFLIDALKAAGIRTTPITSLKKLNIYSESHVGAVLFEEETLSRSGSKTIYRNERGEQQKRRKVFDRSLVYNVVIGEYTAQKVEEIYEKFLSQISQNDFYIDGNYTALEVESADWVEKDDSILKAQVAVQIKIKFQGGVYRDTGYIDTSRKELGIRIERAGGKEPATYGESTGTVEITGAGKQEGSDG